MPQVGLPLALTLALALLLTATNRRLIIIFEVRVLAWSFICEKTAGD